MNVYMGGLEQDEKPIVGPALPGTARKMYEMAKRVKRRVALHRSSDVRRDLR
jgi:hypothetical protein